MILIDNYMVKFNLKYTGTLSFPTVATLVMRYFDSCSGLCRICCQPNHSLSHYNPFYAMWRRKPGKTRGAIVFAFNFFVSFFFQEKKERQELAISNHPYTYNQISIQHPLNTLILVTGQ